MDFQTTIKEIMTRDMVTVSPETRLDDFKNYFERRGFHHIPVQDDTGKLEGIISSEDISRTSHFMVSSHMLLAKHIMTVSPITINEETSIIEAVKVFLDHQFRALPVLNTTGDFVGIITPYDLMREMLHAFEVDEEVKDMEDYV